MSLRDWYQPGQRLEVFILDGDSSLCHWEAHLGFSAFHFKGLKFMTLALKFHSDSSFANSCFSILPILFSLLFTTCLYHFSPSSEISVDEVKNSLGQLRSLGYKRSLC